MNKWLLICLVFLCGCNPELKKELKDFNEIKCKDWCIVNESYLRIDDCLQRCFLRDALKEKI